MLVVFRCDAAKGQGLGHLIRSIAVADAAVGAGWRVAFHGVVGNSLGRAMLEERGYPLHRWSGTAAELADLMADMHADVVHLDSYQDSGPLDRELSQHGVLLSSMEDGTFGRRPAEVVIDPSPVSERSYRPDDGSRWLLRGAKAIPLRRTIPVQEAGKDRAGTNVLVIMGGTDALNMTDDVLQTWLDTGLPGTCHVVAETATARPGPGQQVLLHPPGPDVPSLFPGMDLVISGAGTTVWELAAVGVPMALVQVVENQEDNYHYAIEEGFALGLGVVQRDGALYAPDAVMELRELMADPGRRAAMGEAGRRRVDGRGAGRIVALWHKRLELAPGVRARAATLDDASRLFDWRNDPTVRGVSRTTAELEWESHIDWVERTLGSDDRRLLIVEADREPVGTVRFDRIVEYAAACGEAWEVSITLSPAHRGQGLAAGILSAAERYFLDTCGVDLLIAEMLENNAASHRLFSADGYRAGEDLGLPPAAPSWRRLAKGMRETPGIC